VVAKHGYPLHTHASRKPRVDLRIIAAIEEHGGVHHPATHDLQPAGVAAHPAALAATDEAFAFHFSAGLCERKVGGAHPRAHSCTVHGACKFIHRALQVCQTDVLSNREHLHLQDLAFMAGVHLLVAIAHARQDGADRLRRVPAHDMNLTGRGVGAQDDAILLRMKCVPHIPCGMMGRHVEKFEIIFIRFDFPCPVDLESHFSEDVNDPLQGLLQGVQPADEGFAARQSDIQVFGCQAFLQKGLLDELPLLIERLSNSCLI